MIRPPPGRNTGRRTVAALRVLSLLILAMMGLSALLPGATRGSDKMLGSTLGSSLPASPLSPADIPSCLTQMFEGSPECAEAQMVYDAGDGYLLAEMICVNPSAPVAFNSCTWKYQDGSWSEVVSPNGQQPPALLADGFVWDAADGYVLLFGGMVYPSGHALDASWTYRAGVWTNETSAPTFRVAPVQAVFDSSASVVLATYEQSVGNGTWDTYVYTYRAGIWTNVTHSSPVPTGFPIQAQATDDPADHGVLFFGGVSNHYGVQGNSSWLFVNGSWRHLAGTASPPVLYFPTLGYDSVDGYVLLVGGLLRNCVANPCSFSNAVWEFSGGAWKNTTSTTTGAIPHEAGGVLTTDLSTSSVIEGFGWVGYSGSGINMFESPQLNLYSYLAGTWTEVPNRSGAPAVPLPLLAAPLAVAVGGVLAAIVFFRSRAKHRVSPPR